MKGSNNVGLGYDEGTIVIKLGREEPAISMDSNGKIIWAKHSEMQQANLKAMGGKYVNAKGDMQLDDLIICVHLLACCECS